MNRLLRALWDRLLPPGGDVAVAREADDDGPWIDVHVLEPFRFGDERPQADELDLRGRCWWWIAGMGWLLDQPIESRGPDALWLPHWAIADPGAEP